MARWVNVLALLAVVVVVVSALAATTEAHKLAKPYRVTGKVYCDTCRFGFETKYSPYIPDAVVMLECKDKSATKVVYNQTVTTDSNGAFEFEVYEDHGEQLCDVVLSKSPWPHCKILDKGRYRSRVIVTDSNGIISNHRYANNLGFVQKEALPVCQQLRKFYFQSDDE